MSRTAPQSNHQPTRPTRRLTVVAILAGIVLGCWLWLRDDTANSLPEALNDQQRMPITNPILESDRPDLLGEPGMEMVGHEDDPDVKPN